MSLFGGAQAESLVEVSRHQHEDFDEAVSNEDYLTKKQQAVVASDSDFVDSANRFAEFNDSDNDSSEDFMEERQSEEQRTAERLLAIAGRVSVKTGRKQGAQNSKRKTGKKDIELLDTRRQTMFRYKSAAQRIANVRRGPARSRSKQRLKQLQRQNQATAVGKSGVGIETTFGGKKGFLRKSALLSSVKAKSQLMGATEMRQRYSIIKSKRAGSLLRDRREVGYVARHNLSFLNEVLFDGTAQTGGRDAKRNKFDYSRTRFARRIRLSIGAKNRKTPQNYAVFQKSAKYKEQWFEKKKDEYLKRGLRAPLKMEAKTLRAKFGAKHLYNSFAFGRVGSRKKRSNSKTGAYEFAKHS